MTPASDDLAALRTLMDAVTRVCKNDDLFEQSTLGPELFSSVCAMFQALPAAREALERREEILLKDRGKTNEINILTKENREQTARLARLESLFERANRFITGREDLLSAEIAAALRNQPTDADAAEFQRVHGAAAQADRDVAHWRRRAEHAEARLAQLEGRDER